MTAHIEPAPPGFAFVEIEVASEVASVLAAHAPDLYERIRAGELRWFADLDGDGVPCVTISDTAGATVGSVRLEWRRVGRVESSDDDLRELRDAPLARLVREWDAEALRIESHLRDLALDHPARPALGRALDFALEMRVRCGEEVKRRRSVYAQVAAIFAGSDG